MEGGSPNLEGWLLDLWTVLVKNGYLEILIGCVWGMKEGFRGNNTKTQIEYYVT